MGKEKQGKLFGDDMLPPAKRRRNIDHSHTEYQHVVPEADVPHFAGATFDAKHDEVRLAGKLKKLRQFMIDGRWRTLEHISRTLAALHEGERFPESSVSAALRALRHPDNGDHKVDRKHVGERACGLFAYRVRPASDPEPESRGGAKR